MTMTMENQTAVRTHKGTGIASFIIGVTCVTLVMGLIGTVGVMAKSGKLTPELSMIIGLGIISASLIDLIGIGLGIFGTVDRSSKKVYPVLGLILNAAILLLVGGLIFIGLSVKTH